MGDFETMAERIARLETNINNEGTTIDGRRFDSQEFLYNWLVMVPVKVGYNVNNGRLETLLRKSIVTGVETTIGQLGPYINTIAEFRKSGCSVKSGYLDNIPYGNKRPEGDYISEDIEDIRKILRTLQIRGKEIQLLNTPNEGIIIGLDTVNKKEIGENEKIIKYIDSLLGKAFPHYLSGL